MELALGDGDSHVSVSWAASRIEIRVLGSMEHGAVGCRLHVAELRFGFVAWDASSRGSMHGGDAPLGWESPGLGLLCVSRALVRWEAPRQGSLCGGRLPFWIPWWGGSQLAVGSMVGGLPVGVCCASVKISFGGRLPAGIHCMVGSSHLGFLGEDTPSLSLLCSGQAPSMGLCVAGMLPVGGRLPVWPRCVVGSSHFGSLTGFWGLTPRCGLLGGRFEDPCSSDQVLLRECGLVKLAVGFQKQKGNKELPLHFSQNNSHCSPALRSTPVRAFTFCAIFERCCWSCQSSQQRCCKAVRRNCK
ncbi:uncharacterized protein LOC110393962 [Numida meleagris]|uniref:uncharacterized protein LOC110393962 n=1 Tax=Numida meleagris TaxID=8996 RepID=UPI000B3E2543|nr:uncharacterized protein LOC110393962 [Numida meleagris]